MNPHWLLPEALEDLLPADAAEVERLRRRLLDDFFAHGYEFVMPPLLEYVESLRAGSGRDMDLRSFKLVDQVSGRALALRADITPQAARIDAHLLNRRGVTRLCYCGSVLHTLPADLLASREPLQIGAELFGHAGIEADIEIVRLAARALTLCEVPAWRIDLGHVAIFRALAKHAQLDEAAERAVFTALQAKDAQSLHELLGACPAAIREALVNLTQCYGANPDAFGQRLPDLPEIHAALEELKRLARELPELPLSFDLADLRGYDYHNGVVFAAYAAGSPGAVALGGRYDAVGARFGRARAATGFSMDLRGILRMNPRMNRQPAAPARRGAILAPWPEDAALHTAIDQLRAAGEVVMFALPGHDNTWREAGCDRVLRQAGSRWIIENLKED